MISGRISAAHGWFSKFCRINGVLFALSKLKKITSTIPDDPTASTFYNLYRVVLDESSHPLELILLVD